MGRGARRPPARRGEFAVLPTTHLPNEPLGLGGRAPSRPVPQVVAAGSGKRRGRPCQAARKPARVRMPVPSHTRTVSGL